MKFEKRNLQLPGYTRRRPDGTCLFDRLSVTVLIYYLVCMYVRFMGVLEVRGPARRVYEKFPRYLMRCANTRRAVTRCSIWRTHSRTWTRPWLSLVRFLSFIYICYVYVYVYICYARLWVYDDPIFP